MAAVKFFKTKDSTVTIGSTEEQSAIVSDITLSGGDKEEVSIDAVDGTTYAFAGLSGPINIEFDFIQGESYNITEMVYGPETTSSSPVLHTLNWNGDGEAKTITIANVRSADTQTYTLTLTDVDGISAPIVFVKGQAITRSFKGVVASQNVAETVLEGV